MTASPKRPQRPRLLPDQSAIVRNINLTRLSGRLLERGTLRHTPSGVPLVEFRLVHASRQIEAETERQVECEMDGVALGVAANLLAATKLGDELAISGFLAARSLRRRTPVLHVTLIEFVEGN